MSKRTRQWVLGGVIAILVFFVWWVYFQAPSLENSREIAEKKQFLKDRRIRLTGKLADLENTHPDNMENSSDMTAVELLVVKGESLEEVNAVVQGMIQNFLAENDILLQKYQVLRPGRWMEYELGRLEFSIQTRHLELSELLKFLGNMEQLVRVERFNVNYSRGKTHTLRVTFRLEILFVDERKTQI